MLGKTRSIPWLQVRWLLMFMSSFHQQPCCWRPKLHGSLCFMRTISNYYVISVLRYYIFSCFLWYIQHDMGKRKWITAVNTPFQWAIFVPLTSTTRNPSNHPKVFMLGQILFDIAIKAHMKIFRFGHNGYREAHTFLMSHWKLTSGTVAFFLLLELLPWCPIFKSSFQLIWRSGTFRFHLRVLDLQTSCRDFTTWQGTRMTVPVVSPDDMTCW